MDTAASRLLNIEFPIFAFTHCRDVAAAVTNAGGIGVLGAVAHTPEQLDVDLRWIEEQVNGKPFGVDLLIPQSFVGAGQGGLERKELKSRIPPEHIAFVEGMLERYGVPPLPPPTEGTPRLPTAGLQVDPKSMGPLIDVAFSHDIRLVASALGSPPAWLIYRAHAKGVAVAALAGTVGHAVRHRDAGVDLIIAQGTEAGGHTGEIATMVLVPQVVDAVAPTPVLAAGGIADGRQVAASLALGADGVWCGSVWLTTEEAETTPPELEKCLAATSSDTVRSRSITGKPARMLRSAWTEAWEGPESPGALPMPLQSMLSYKAQRRVERVSYRADATARELLTPVVGQVVGMMNSVKPARRVVLEMVEQFIDAMVRIERIAGVEQPQTAP